MRTKKTLNKIISAGMGLGMLTGCAGMGAVMSGSDDPATRAMGTLMYIEGSHEQRMEEAEAGRSEVNVNVDRKQESFNKKEWYIDKNLIPSGEIGPETRCIYSVLVQDDFYSNDTNKYEYVKNMRKVNFQNCPYEFVEAFSRHLAAWNKANENFSKTKNEIYEEIDKTFYRVMGIALSYGVCK